MSTQQFALPSGATPVDAAPQSSSVNSSQPQQFPLPSGVTPVQSSSGSDLANIGNGGASDQDPATANGQGGDPISGGVAEGLADAAKPIVQAVTHPISTIWHMLPPVQLADSTKQSLSVINAYEKARSSGKSVPDAIQAADLQARQQDTIAQEVQQRVAEFKKNPTQESVRALTNVATLAASIWGGGEVADAGEGADVAAGADAAAVESNPIEAAQTKAVSKIADKANVPEGAAATEEVPEVTNEDEAPTVESKQPEVHQNIRDAANAIAEREGFTPPSPKTPISEVMSKGIGDQFYARAKAGYAEIEDAVPGTNLETLDTRISDLQQGIKKSFGDAEKIADLKEQLAGAQSDRLAAANKIEEAGLDPDAPSRDWKGYKSAYDVQNKAITPSVKGKVGIGSGETVDPNGLATRLKNMSVSKTATQPGRLQQFMGKDVADTLRNNIEQHASDIKTFEPKVTPAQPALPATDQQALKELIQPTAGKVWGTNTDWGKALEKFDALGDEAQKAQFTNPSAVRAAIRGQATKQALIKGGLKGGIVAEVLHRLGVPYIPGL